MLYSDWPQYADLHDSPMMLRVFMSASPATEQTDKQIWAPAVFTRRLRSLKERLTLAPLHYECKVGRST